MDKLRVREVILVEGKYDKIALGQVVDALILTTEGFGALRDRPRLALFRRLARERGVILFTDSDGAGLVIRGRLRGVLPPEGVKEAFIPDVPGKERRKRAPGREGKLGVEGMPPQVLRDALVRCGATLEGEEAPRERPFTKTTLFELGLSGVPEARARRRALQRALELPENLSANALLTALNALTTPREVAALLASPGFSVAQEGERGYNGENSLPGGESR